MSQRDTDPWFTVEQVGHVPLKLESLPIDDQGEPTDDLAAVRECVERTYPHVIELTVREAPLMPLLMFEEPKRPWTSFFSRSERMVYLAFTDVKDAVEGRLRL